MCAVVFYVQMDFGNAQGKSDVCILLGSWQKVYKSMCNYNCVGTCPVNGGVHELCSGLNCKCTNLNTNVT